VRADEWPSPYYEDDAWYDVTEWFDGNDYNPTDEAIGRWDDEKFSFADNATSTDSDNDTAASDSKWSDYGYADNSSADSTSDNGRWFYDHYDDGYRSWDQDNSGWNSYSVYNDTNDDGLYDNMAYFYDTDNDGLYEDYWFYSFDSSSQNDQKAKMSAQNQQKDSSSKREQISGTIDSTKKVDVRDRTHLVANVKASNGKMMAVDLGPQQSTQLSKGDQLSATGHRVKVGDKTVLIASQAQSKDADLKIDRSGRSYSGQIASTREVTVRGQKHLLAKVKTDDGKSMLVDLGASDQLSSLPKEGAKLTVQGVPVKIKDRVILMARSIEQDGNKVEIKRRTMSKS
jgi:hypothetical protein